MTTGLVGSEMCIRDSRLTPVVADAYADVIEETVGTGEDRVGRRVFGALDEHGAVVAARVLTNRLARAFTNVAEALRERCKHVSASRVD